MVGRSALTREQKQIAGVGIERAILSVKIDSASRDDRDVAFFCLPIEVDLSFYEVETLT